MSRFIDAAIGYPTAIFTVLLLVLLVVLGDGIAWAWVDFESSGVDMELELQADGDPGEVSTLAGYMVAMGLNGVPFSIVASILVLVSWTFSWHGRRVVDALGADTGPADRGRHRVFSF